MSRNQWLLLPIMHYSQSAELVISSCVKRAIDELLDEATTDTARNSTYLTNVLVKMKSILGEQN